MKKSKKTTYKFPKKAEAISPALPPLGVLLTDLPSEEYHGCVDSYSSSQLKTMLEDAELFHAKYIAKTVEREEIAAFGIGSYFHAAILEPHTLERDFAVFPGRRTGAKWDAFKIKHKGKCIITERDLEVADKLAVSVKSSPVAMSRVNEGRAEVSLFTAVFVTKAGDIYSETPGDKWALLTPAGWEPAPSLDLDEERGEWLTLKVRADLLGDTYILDLKSTSGNCKNVSEMRRKVTSYDYDLSAALYVDMFSLHKDAPLDFLWTFASKDFSNSKTWRATDLHIRVGRAKWSKAVRELAKCISEGWKFKDELGEMGPDIYQLQHLKEEKDSDLL